MQNVKLLTILFFVLLLTTLCSETAWSQQSESGTFLNRASQYYLGNKDEILMNVNIWGFVSKPGQYLVPRHTNLIALMSFAGGPIEGADLKTVRIIRQIDQLAMANGLNGNSDGSLIVSVNVKQYLETGKADLIPLLQAGDTILINPTFGNKVQKFLGFGSLFGIIAAGASLALILERIAW